MDGVGTSIIEMPQTLACRDTPVYLNYRYSYKCEELESTIGFCHQSSISQSYSSISSISSNIGSADVIVNINKIIRGGNM